jgi:hypothetical protein
MRPLSAWLRQTKLGSGLSTEKKKNVAALFSSIAFVLCLVLLPFDGLNGFTALSL